MAISTRKYWNNAEIRSNNKPHHASANRFPVSNNIIAVATFEETSVKVHSTLFRIKLIDDITLSR